MCPYYYKIRNLLVDEYDDIVSLNLNLQMATQGKQLLHNCSITTSLHHGSLLLAIHDYARHVKMTAFIYTICR